MQWLINFLRALFLLAPREILIAFLKILYILIILIILLILFLIEWFRKLGGNLYAEETDEPCGQLPEAAMRRPDPCIYSQQLLMSQGLPVTWNNPDVWVAPADDPTNVEPDSYHLEDDKDYIVFVQAHNASTDAAIGVRVRLNYRPWSFGSPDLTPVEVDSASNEVAKFVNISPMGSAIAQFKWHTPKLDQNQPSQHYCLQASVYHPLDVNTANNMGQENTQVYRTDNPGFVSPGDTVMVTVPLTNLAKRPQTIQLNALQYAIDKDNQYQLKLKTTHGYAHMALPQRLANTAPKYHLGKGFFAMSSPSVMEAKPGLLFETKRRLRSVKTRYEGFDKLTDRLLAGDYRLPDGMTVTANGAPIENGIIVEAKTEKNVDFEITVPADAAPGSTYPVNLLAKTEDGRLVGGVTLIINVKD